VDLDASHPYHILKECLWGKFNELKDTIFRYVKISEQDFVRLQAALTVAAPDRFQEGYVAQCDVLEIKSRILGLVDSSEDCDMTDSPTTCDPRVTGHQMPSFPLHFKIMDLRILELDLLPEDAILIREEYEILEEMFLEKLRSGKQGSVFLTGQPGIGEFSQTGSILVC
jgi:hypothetical protein